MMVLAGIVLAAAAPAGQPGWVVAAPTSAAPGLSRALGGVSVEYRTAPEDYDKVRLTVEACGQNPWYQEDSIDPQGNTAAERAADVRQDIAEQFSNARLNCTLPDDAEARLMEGFDAAYVHMDATRK
jgi:hypothetical protein